MHLTWGGLPCKLSIVIGFPSISKDLENTVDYFSDIAALVLDFLKLFCLSH